MMHGKKFMLAGVTAAVMIAAIVFALLLGSKKDIKEEVVETATDKNIQRSVIRKKVLEETKEQIQNTLEEKFSLNEEKIKGIYDDFIYNTLYEKYGHNVTGSFSRKLADDRTSEYSPITNMWYAEPLNGGEKGLMNTCLEDLDGDEIPELIVTILGDSGEYYTDDDGNSIPEDAWIELHAYRITDGKVTELEQSGDQNRYPVFGVDYRGTWCCFNVQSGGKKYVMVLSLFSNGRFEVSYDCRASVFQMQDDSFQCLYSKKIGSEGLIDLDSIPLDEQSWRGNLYPMSPEDTGVYGYKLSDELQEYCDLSGTIPHLFAELGVTEKLDIVTALPEYAQAISEIKVYSVDSDTVEYFLGTL